MQIFLFISLAVAAIAVLFALQNTTVVEINFLFWSFEGSLALVLLIALGLGILVSFFASLPSLIRSNMTARNQGKRISDLEGQLSEQKALLEGEQTRLAEAQQRIQALEQPPAEEDNPQEQPEAGDEQTPGKSLWRS